MIKTLVLSLGAYEDSYLGYIVATHKKGFKTLKGAVGNLGRIFYGVLEEVRKGRFRDCCQEKMQRKKVPSFCSDCGAQVSHYQYEIDYLDFETFVSEQLALPSHSFEAMDEIENSEWVLWIEGNPFEDTSQVVLLSGRVDEWLSWGCDLRGEAPESPVQTLNGDSVKMG